MIRVVPATPIETGGENGRGLARKMAGVIVGGAGPGQSVEAPALRGLVGEPVLILGEAAHRDRDTGLEFQLGRSEAVRATYSREDGAHRWEPPLARWTMSAGVLIGTAGELLRVGLGCPSPPHLAAPLGLARLDPGMCALILG
ncbi:hypothetical protein NDU88_007906 [Pleurodeles waltl]|uniref:Uncharacterized protein n=1 Tax=Pleurodeles waltl TaxID=8319 RepID=A0AAV7N3D4_PLEWA|nr:hypothetical protein NDU88_007906 [Pleurodeles waltl]